MELPFDPTKPYCRRDGKPAKVIYKLKNSEYVVLTETSNGLEYVYGFNPNIIVSSDSDLINIPEKIEGWIVIYEDLSVSPVYLSLDIAMNGITMERKYGCINQIACIKVCFMKGEGLK